jgi:hypothetical protein
VVVGILATTVAGCLAGAVIGAVFTLAFRVPLSAGVPLSAFVGGMVALLLGAVDEFVLSARAGHGRARGSIVEIGPARSRRAAD